MTLVFPLFTTNRTTKFGIYVGSGNELLYFVYKLSRDVYFADVTNSAFSRFYF